MTELEQIAASIRGVISDLEQLIAADSRLPMWQEPFLMLATALEKMAVATPELTDHPSRVTNLAGQSDPKMPPGAMLAA